MPLCLIRPHHAAFHALLGFAQKVLFCLSTAPDGKFLQQLGDFLCKAADGRLGRTQYLLPQAEALNRLNTRQTVEPSAMIGRNAFSGPNVYFYDMSLLKRFVVGEHANVSFEANFFNVFNRANFGAPVTTLTNPRFGQILNTASGTNPRQIQFGLKVNS